MAEGGYTGAIHYLLKHGVSPDHMDQNGDNPATIFKKSVKELVKLTTGKIIVKDQTTQNTLIKMPLCSAMSKI